jgi:transcriptional regulator with XRE-family HTH domain
MEIIGLSPYVNDEIYVGNEAKVSQEARKFTLDEWYGIIGINVIRLRTGEGMSQKKLATAAKVGRSTILAVESGAGCSLANLIKIAEVLKASPADLFMTGTDRQDVSYKAKLLWDRLSVALGLDKSSGVDDAKRQRGRADPDKA